MAAMMRRSFPRMPSSIRLMEVTDDALHEEVIEDIAGGGAGKAHRPDLDLVVPIVEHGAREDDGLAIPILGRFH